jgi:hypothetical protein
LMNSRRDRERDVSLLAGIITSPKRSLDQQRRG